MAFDTVPAAMDVPWYLVRCQSRKELYAAKSLDELLGVFVYCPQVRFSQRGTVTTMPFFPGYLFICADLEKIAPSQINACPGVVHLVTFGGEVPAVPAPLVEAIFERVQSMDGLKRRQTFHPGDVVRLKQQTTLQDLEMIFVGSITSGQRVSVLLNLLGRLKTVYVDINTLEKVTTHANKSAEIPAYLQKRERYTRGKGRKVKKWR